MILITSETGGLASNHRVRKASARNVTATVPGRHLGAISILTYVNAIFAWLQKSKRDIWSIDLVGIVVIDVTHADDERSLGQTDLGGVVVQRQECDPCLRIEPDRCRAHMDFSPRVLVSPRIVAAHDRTIWNGRDPVIFARRTKRHRSL